MMKFAEELWQKNRALAIALLVGVVIVGYIVYKKAQSAIVAPAAPAPVATTGPGGTITNIYETTTTTNSTTAPPIKQPPVPPMGPPAWLPPIPNGSKLIPNWAGLPWGWQAPGSKIINGLNPPAGTKIWQGSQGRWWYAVPGGPETLLTTS